MIAALFVILAFDMLGGLSIVALFAFCLWSDYKSYRDTHAQHAGEQETR